MKHMRVIILALICMPVHAWFEHGRAVVAADSGDWQRANSLLNTTLINNPHDPCVVYDAGVAAYKVGDHKQALAYFTHVTQMPHASDTLKERALFNAGNAQVKLKQLQEAITCYEQALQLDAHDKHAQHNLEIVKKMLQEEKKQEQDKQEDKKDDQQESSCAKAPADRQEQESDEQKQADAKDKESQERSEKNKKQADEQKKQRESAEQKKEKEQGATADDKKSQEQLNTRLDKQLIQVLEQQEKHDAQVNKQMIKETVGSQMGGTHGKQGW